MFYSILYILFFKGYFAAFCKNEEVIKEIILMILGKLPETKSVFTEQEQGQRVCE